MTHNKPVRIRDAHPAICRAQDIASSTSWLEICKRLVAEHDELERLRPRKPSAVKESIGHLQALTQFAYEQGFHELGYDPVRTVADALGVAVPEPKKGS